MKSLGSITLNYSQLPPSKIHMQDDHERWLTYLLNILYAFCRRQNKALGVSEVPQAGEVKRENIKCVEKAHLNQTQYLSHKYLLEGEEEEARSYT
ncbi:hypothetical protein PR048_009337 [Dryococelus australis]|uniref:Uncharacterized protein n=1 Tax=Dryococelus australis TaxID=614101 RepID=A0ABQ9HZN4_9NEOP|nr:hypothetical protein PR048_009337 [Dryococelus australis]